MLEHFITEFITEANISIRLNQITRLVLNLVL